MKTKQATVQASPRCEEFTIIVASLGCWGKGESLREAKNECKKVGGKGKMLAWVIVGDAKAFIDDDGRISRKSGSQNISLGEI